MQLTEFKVQFGATAEGGARVLLLFVLSTILVLALTDTLTCGHTVSFKDEKFQGELEGRQISGGQEKILTMVILSLFSSFRHQG